MLPIAPPYYVDLKAGLVGRIACNLPDRKAQRLAAAPEIAPVEAAAFAGVLEHRLAAAAPRLRVADAAIDVEVLAEAILHAKGALERSLGRSRQRSSARIIADMKPLKDRAAHVKARNRGGWVVSFADYSLPLILAVSVAVLVGAIEIGRWLACLPGPGAVEASQRWRAPFWGCWR